MTSKPLFDWPFYIATGVTALAFSIVLSGCRFGNYTQNGVPADPISGYYYSSAASLVVIATDNSGNKSQVTANVNLIPGYPGGDINDFPLGINLGSVMTNPVLLYMNLADVTDDPATRPGVLVSSVNQSMQFNTTLNATDMQTLYFLGNTSTFPIWKKDASCNWQIFVEEKGKVVPDPNPTTPAGSPVQINGRIQVTFDVSRTISGANCTQILTSMKACLLDVTQCGGASSDANQGYQQDAYDALNLFIESGTIGAADIPNLKSLGYKVSYQ